MNIRKSLDNILKKYGYDLIYIRRDKRFKCSCYSERSSGQTSSSCNKCFGTGYKVAIEKIRSRRKIAPLTESLVRAGRNYEIGNVSGTAFLYFIQHDVKPKKGDILLEVEWKNGVPFKIKEKHFISIADPKHGAGGRIEFYQVYVKYDTERPGDENALT